MRAFIDEQRTLVCATNGLRGWPHLMPLWFVVRGPDIWAWTFAKSQKVRNLERDPRATLQIETGETYDQLRGVMLEATVDLHRDTEAVAALGAEILARYSGGPASARHRRCHPGPGAQARRNAVRARARGQLGPPQARRHLLAASPRSP